MNRRRVIPLVNKRNLTVGSVCSGIEALGYSFVWFSEIARFPSLVLQSRHPFVPNLGDMDKLPILLANKEIDAPDIICGGTPCQAFSLAGKKEGLGDQRGNLTLRFVDIVDSADSVRLTAGRSRTIVFWENVEGVLTDKTNAFGCLISALAGLSDAMSFAKWMPAGVVKGPKRNVAWRVLDAKYFGLPQQRRRLYLLSGGKDFLPENVLFDYPSPKDSSYANEPLQFERGGHKFEVFREYSDCLYSAYGTKWNGNAAANNGSLFVVQDGRLRRFSPLECERLMGFPDQYTDIPGARKTNRFQALGNSWAVPVVRWIGSRIELGFDRGLNAPFDLLGHLNPDLSFSTVYNFGSGTVRLSDGRSMNTGPSPARCKFRSLATIVSPEAPESLYITPVGCCGILRRSKTRNLALNSRLRFYLEKISSKMAIEEIEKKSRIQKRGRFG